MSAEKGHEKVVRLSFRVGNMDVGAEDKNWRMPPWWAVAKGHATTVELVLFTSNTDPDAKDNNNQVPL